MIRCYLDPSFNVISLEKRLERPQATCPPLRLVLYYTITCPELGGGKVYNADAHYSPYFY